MVLILPNKTSNTIRQLKILSIAQLISYEINIISFSSLNNYIVFYDLFQIPRKYMALLCLIRDIINQGGMSDFNSLIRLF